MFQMAEKLSENRENTGLVHLLIKKIYPLTLLHAKVYVLIRYNPYFRSVFSIF